MTLDPATTWRRWAPGLAVAGAIHGAALLALLVEITRSPPPVAAPPSLAVELVQAPTAPVPQTRPMIRTPSEAPAPEPRMPPSPPIALRPAPPQNMISIPLLAPTRRASEPPRTSQPPQPPATPPASAAQQATQERVATASSGAPDAAANWEAMVVAAIDRAKRYPASARFARQEATVYASFVVDRQGKVKLARLVRPSGVPDLDAEVLSLLRRVKLPAPPASIPEQGAVLVVPIDFSLVGG